MSYELYTGAPDDMQAKVAYLMQLFSYARLQRVGFEVQWEESAAIAWPEYRASFSFGHQRSPGVKYSQFQVDSSIAIKMQRFAAIADYMITPFTKMWSELTFDDPELMKQRDVQLWLERWSKIIWAERYKSATAFQFRQNTNWHSLGVFGNQNMLLEEYDSRPGPMEKGIAYIGCAPGEIYILENHQGRIDGFIRHSRMTARQAYQKWDDKIPQQLAAAAEKADQYTMWDFLHFVIPRTDYDPMKLFTAQGKPWASIHVSVVGYNILEEGGYYSFPLATGRYMQAPEEWYGRGPMQQFLPEAKTKNTEKEAFLRQGKLAGDPFYLLPDDGAGLYDFKAESGAFNYGMVNEAGNPLVHTMKTGEIQITKELMDDSDKIIDAGSLIDLFPLLFDKSGQQRSARETMEVTRQMAIFLAPTLGRNYSEYLPAMLMREIEMLRRQGKQPPIPPVLREAKAKPRPHYTSPLALAFEAEGIGGFMRSVEMAGSVAQATGDQSVFDPFDFDTAIPAMSIAMHSPASYMASPAAMAKKRQQRAQQQERENQAKEMPARAAMLKAQAIMSKAQTGGNIGGTLSGTPDGGMPAIPGNAPGQPGQPSLVPGQPGLSGRPAP